MFARRCDNVLPALRLPYPMQSIFGSLLDTAASVSPLNCVARAVPALNLWEDETNVYAEAEVPGMQLADLDVSVLGSELSIKGSRTEEKHEDAVYHRRERVTEEFSRTVGLPVEIDEARVKAVLRHGVLTITLPKAKSVLPKKIEVQS